MKRIFMTVAAAFLAASAMAQVQIGPKVGMNLYKINDGEKAEEGVKEPFAVGFNLGVATSFGISDNFAIAPELIFTQKGSRIKYEGTEMDFDGMATVELDYSETNTTKLNYLEMPVLGRVSFGDAVKGYANVGPSIGYWLGGRGKGEYKFGEESESYDVKLKFVSEYDQDSEDEQLLTDDYNRVELGAVLGGGVMIDTGAGDILFDARYQAGLTNLFKVEEGDDDRNWKNNGLSVSVIYLLGSK